MQTTSKPARQRAGRPPAFKPGELGDFLENRILLEIDQEIARLKAARAAIITGARRGRTAASRRS